MFLQGEGAYFESLLRHTRDEENKFGDMKTRQLHQINQCSFIDDPDEASSEEDEDCPRPDNLMPPLDGEDADYLDDGDESNFADLEEDRILSTSRRFDQASYINIVYLYCILILLYVFKYLRFTAGH